MTADIERKPVFTLMCPHHWLTVLIAAKA